MQGVLPGRAGLHQLPPAAHCRNRLCGGGQGGQGRALGKTSLELRHACMTCQLLNMISPASGLLSYYCCSLPPASWSAGGTRTTRTLPRLFGTLVRVHCSGNSKGAVRRLQSLQFSPPLPAHCQVTAASACCPPAACPSAHNDVVFVLELIQQHQTPDACPSLVLPDPQAKAATTCCTAGSRWRTRS